MQSIIQSWKDHFGTQTKLKKVVKRLMYSDTTQVLSAPLTADMEKEECLLTTYTVLTAPQLLKGSSVTNCFSDMVSI